MFGESVEAYRTAAQLNRADPVATAEVLSRQAAARLRTGAFTTTLRTVTRARRLIDGSQLPVARSTRVRLDPLTAVVRVEQERPREAREWALRAMEGAGEAGEHETQVRALMLVDMVDLQLGVPGLGDRHREALEICVRHGLRSQEAKVRSNLGAMAYYAGRWTEAAQWYRTSRDVAIEAGSAFVAAQTDVNLGELLINQGHLDEARAGARRCGPGAAGVRRAAVPRRGTDAAGPGCTSAGGSRRAEQRRPGSSETFTDLDNPTSALEAALVRAEAGSPHAAGARSPWTSSPRRARRPDHAAFSMPRMCLQRARALVALDRLDEATEQVALGLVAAVGRSCPRGGTAATGLRASPTSAAGSPRTPALARERSDRLLAGLGAVG